MKKLVSLFAGLIFVFTTACDNHDDQKYKTVDPRAIQQDTSLTKPQRSDKLTEAAEELMTPTGFVYAEMIIDLALAENPDNKKAQLYKHLLQIKSPLRGLYKRIKPLAMSSDYSKRHYESAMKDLPDANLKTYLLDAANEDIKTEADLQVVIDKVYAAAEKFRQFVKSNKDLETTLRLSEATRDMHTLSRHLPECIVDVVDGVFKIKEGCRLRTINFKVNRADMEMLAQLAGAYQIYAMLGTSYDLSSAVSTINLYDSKKNSSEALSNKDFYANLAKDSKFGVLRQENKLKSVLSMGSDLVPAVKWAMSMQSELCKAPDANGQRRGGHLFYDGACVTDGDAATRFMALAEIIVSGKQTQAVFGKYHDNAIHLFKDEETVGDVGPEFHKTKLLGSKVFTNPITDLKQQELVFNSCDQVSAIKDQSLNGAFVLSDANKALEKLNACGTN